MNITVDTQMQFRNFAISHFAFRRTFYSVPVSTHENCLSGFDSEATNDSAAEFLH